MGKIVCEKCRRKCRGDVLKVTNKYFHKGCFTCTKCNVSLEKGGFFMKDDGFYCQDDYQRYFVAKCQICSQDLIGEIVTVMNFSFHRECFKCTNCSTPFHPGDRVTVWQERFFCPHCISQQCVTVPLSPPIDQGPKINGNSALSPLSVTDDEGCISAAEASLSEFASPQGNAHPNSVTNKLSNSIKPGEFRLPSSDAKCISSVGVPQKSKSILRKSGTEPTRARTSSREHGYLSTDSGLGERLYDSKALEDQSHTLTLPDRSGGLNYSEIHSAVSPTLSSHQSRQSLHARVPNSDYGRHLSQSYMNLDDPPSQSDRYKRNVSFTALNKPTKPKHFHIPEAKNRFLPPGTRTCELLFGQPMRSSRTNTDMSRSSSSQTRRVVPGSRIAQSAMELDQKTADTSVSMSIPRDLPNGTVYPPTNGVVFNGTRDTKSSTTSSTLRANVGASGEEQEVTAEARRLACYPAGQQRDQSVPAPIERYDWPGPPASAVILAELMRERRYRRRGQGRVNGTHAEDGDDADSQDALSIDCGFDGSANEQSTPKHSSGIGRAILREEMEQKRRSQSHQFLDPISASRTPNAAHEPLFKPRYSTHQFALSEHRSATSYRGSPTRMMQQPIQSGQPIRPGYTGGQLSASQKTSSLPASSLLLNSSRTGHTSTLWQSRHRLPQERPSVKSGQGDTSISDRSYSQSLHGLSQMGAPRMRTVNGLGVLTSTDTDAVTPNGALSPGSTTALPNGTHEFNTDLSGLTGNTLSYPSVLLTSTPSAMFHRPNPPPPPKTIPYNELQAFRTKVPKGVDRTALETHLSEEEFEQVFRLSRPAFYRLPEWKRNDLKRRVNLF